MPPPSALSGTLYKHFTSGLNIPPPRSNVVLRPRLIERLHEGLHRRMTVISASAGYGKTTLVSEWLAGCGRRAAWLSLDEGDNDPARFLTYLVAAFRTIGGISEKACLVCFNPLSHCQPNRFSRRCSMKSPPSRTISYSFLMITTLLMPEAIAFLLEHMPPKMHLVIATREYPRLPLPRLRVRDQLVELRATELRFTSSEAAEFLSRVMGLNLSPEDVSLLESRTEGWIAGLQLAALSMQGHKDTTGFIQSFTGSHHFVIEYLVEEVRQQQPASIQTF